MDVLGFHDSLESMMRVPIGTSATAYDHSDLQETIILIFPQSLYFGNSMEHSLISPNQLQQNGLVVDTCPWQFLAGESMHGIYDPTEELYLEFQMHGCISYLPTRLLTDKELDDCWYIYMMAESEWDPYAESFACAEKPFEGTWDVQPKHSEHYDHVGHMIGGSTSSPREPNVDPGIIAHRFGITKQRASQTLKVTTQQGVYHFSPLADGRFHTRQSHLHYPHL